MSQEQILDALQFIDDDMIESVNVLRKYPERHKHLWLNYVAVAACVVLAILGGFKYLGSNAPTQEQSNGGTNETQNEVADMFGDAGNKEQSGNSETLDNNSSNGVEYGGSTGNASNAGSSTDVSWHYRPAYLLITEVNDDGFKAKVLDNDKERKDFEIGQIVNIIYDDDAIFRGVNTLKTGDKVYVYYSIDNNNSTRIIACEIVSEDLIS